MISRSRRRRYERIRLGWRNKRLLFDVRRIMHLSNEVNNADIYVTP